MKKIFTSLCATCVMFLAFGQEGMEYYLPADISYNTDIPTPEEFFKQELGEWHLTHGQVLNYMNKIASISDRAIIYEYAMKTNPWYTWFLLLRLTMKILMS